MTWTTVNRCGFWARPTFRSGNALLHRFYESGMIILGPGPSRPLYKSACSRYVGEDFARNGAPPTTSDDDVVNLPGTACKTCYRRVFGKGREW